MHSVQVRQEEIGASLEFDRPLFAQFKDTISLTDALYAVFQDFGARLTDFRFEGGQTNPADARMTVTFVTPPIAEVVVSLERVDVRAAEAGSSEKLLQILNATLAALRGLGGKVNVRRRALTRLLHVSVVDTDARTFLASLAPLPQGKTVTTLEAEFSHQEFTGTALFQPSVVYPGALYLRLLLFSVSDTGHTPDVVETTAAVLREFGIQADA